MILALVLATTIEGPTVRAPRPKETLRADEGDALPLKQPIKRQGEWASLLDAHPETEVQRGGSPMIPVSVHLRGARSHHLTLTLDGLPLSDALGGAMTLRSLDPGLMDQARLYSGTGASLESPIGGELRLSQQRGPRFEFSASAGSQDTAYLKLRHRHEGFRVGFSSLNTGGQFRYFDHRGTYFNSRDDRWVKRTNNDAARAVLHMSHHSKKNRLIHAIFSQLSGGIPGLGHRPFKAVREAENLALIYARKRQHTTRYRHELTASLAQRNNRLDDPRAEFSGLAGLQPRNTQHRAMLLGRTFHNHSKSGWELATRLGVDHLQRRSGPTAKEPASAQRYFGRMAVSYRWGETTRWHSYFWCVGSAALDQLQPLIDQLPESLMSTPSTAPTMAINPGLSLAWGRRINLRVIHASRRPSVLEIVGQHGGLRGNPALRYERGTTLDARSDLGSKNRRFTLRLFGRHADDLIDWTATSFGRATPINRSSVDVLGASSNIHLKTRSWRLTSSYRWQHEWVYDNPLENQARRLTASPTHRFKSSLWWTGTHLRLGTFFDWSSARYLDAANLRQQQAQGRLDLSLGYRFSPSQPMTLSLHVMNALDTQQSLLYLMPGTIEVQAPLQDRWGQVLPGRRFMIGFHMRQQR